MCEAANDCRCHLAVTNAYRQLRGRGITDVAAFDTATIIFRFHHPEKTVMQARATVSDWLDGETEVRS